MKKLISSLLAACMCLGVFSNLGSLPINAEEVTPYEEPTIETREADWPDVNYGGWMDTVKDPSKKQKVYDCIWQWFAPAATSYGIAFVYQLVKKGTLKTIPFVTLADAISFTFCLAS